MTPARKAWVLALIAAGSLMGCTKPYSGAQNAKTAANECGVENWTFGTKYGFDYQETPPEFNFALEPERAEYQRTASGFGWDTSRRTDTVAECLRSSFEKQGVSVRVDATVTAGRMSCSKDKAALVSANIENEGFSLHCRASGGEK